MKNPIELLAPVGNSDTFFAALAGGADAVYVGAPGCNARNLARDLRLEEIGAMIRHCHAHDKKLYVAANSLVLERELPALIDTLGALEALRPDALIIQDLGLLQLVRRHFPGLKFHASTLMTAHNSQSVELFARLGCERVVLARELSVAEIAAICRNTSVEIEVFIHGAMCFSYSGLCLFSSYLGGKSGLRGRCVQPCRRAYTTGEGRHAGRSKGKGGYLFSMNDLSGLAAIPDLVQAGVRSLKIEGRLRSAHYVETVVRAYRLVLDAAEADREAAMTKASQMLDNAMSRKITPGYFFAIQPAEAITPFHSGNLGRYLGRAELARTKNKGLLLVAKAGLALGDRLRLHLEPSGDRFTTTVKSLLVKGAAVTEVMAGSEVEIDCPVEIQGLSYRHIDVYKIDMAASGAAASHPPLQVAKVKAELVRLKAQISKRLEPIKWLAWQSSIAEEEVEPEKPLRRPPARVERRPKGGAAALVKLPLEWWLKTDSTQLLEQRLPLVPDRFIVPMDRRTLGQAGQLRRVLGNRQRQVIWALPPVIFDQEYGKYAKYIELLIRSGFRNFQLGHLSQVEMFRGERVHLAANHTISMLNNQAVQLAGEAGFSEVQLAIEADRESLRELIQGYKQLGAASANKGAGKRSVKLGLTVYGRPALYTSRLATPFFPYDSAVVSPKDESFVIRKKDGFTETLPLRPFSLLPYLTELKAMGLDYVVIDLSGSMAGKKDIQDLSDRISGTGRHSKLATFNYLGKLE